MDAQKDRRDEITWSDLENHLLWWVGLFNRTLFFFWGLFKRHLWLYAIVLFLFAFLALSVLYSESQTYQVKTTFVYGDLHPKIFGDMMSKLNNLIKNKSWDKVAGLTHLPVSDAKKISSVKVYNSRGKAFANNYTLAKEPMIIEINLKDSIDEVQLESGIVKYLNDNPFTAERLDLKKRLFQEELEYINTKQKVIDTILVSFMDQEPKEKSNITIDDSKAGDTYDLLKFSNDLVKRKTEVSNGLVNPENVFPIDNFIILPKARFSLGSILKFLIASQILGFFVVSASLIWREKLSKIGQ